MYCFEFLSFFQIIVNAQINNSKHILRKKTQTPLHKKKMLRIDQNIINHLSHTESFGTYIHFLCFAF